MREITTTKRITVKQVELAAGEAVLLVDGDTSVAFVAGKTGDKKTYPSRMKVFIGSQSDLEQKAKDDGLKVGNREKYLKRIGRDKWGKKTEAAPATP